MDFVIDNEDIMLVEEYKKKYDYIYMTEVCDIQFVWREVTRKEFKKLVQYFPDAYEREEQLCKMCVVEPLDFDFTDCEAGIAFTVASHILQESGFSTSGDKVNMLLGQYRSEMNTFENMADAVITEAFPNITLEELQEWSTEKILKYYAMAEYKLAHYRGVVFTESDEPEGTMLEDGTVLQGDYDDFPELS
jgi:lysozyme family protein